MVTNSQRYRVNFPEHMNHCEFNYHRLRRLMPGSCGVLQHIDIEHIFEWGYWVGGDRQTELGIMIRQQDRAKYTTTVHMTIYSPLQHYLPWFKKPTTSNSGPRFSSASVSPSNSGLLPSLPVLYAFDVKLSHDASVAEVTAWQGIRRFNVRYDYPNQRMYQRDEKAQLNRFLGELLAYCLSQGRLMQDVVSMGTHCNHD